MAKQKKNLLVNFILDETGSMYNVLDETISAFNEYVDTLKNGKDKNQTIKMTLTKFNSSKVEIVYSGKDIKDIPKLTNKTYKPDNLTPLYDAVGKTIVDTEKQTKNKKVDVLFVIMTDGQENSSREYTKDIIFKKIKEKEGEGWAFAFLGAGKDAYDEGFKMGVEKINCIKFTQSDIKKGIRRAGGMSMCYARGQSSSKNLFNKK